MLLSNLLKTIRPKINGGASNAGVYEKLTILDECLVDHCWMLTPDHIWTTVLAYRT